MISYIQPILSFLFKQKVGPKQIRNRTPTSISQTRRNSGITRLLRISSTDLCFEASRVAGQSATCGRQMLLSQVIGKVKVRLSEQEPSPSPLSRGGAGAVCRPDEGRRFVIETATCSAATRTKGADTRWPTTCAGRQGGPATAAGTRCLAGRASSASLKPPRPGLSNACRRRRYLIGGRMASSLQIGRWPSEGKPQEPLLPFTVWTAPS